MRRTEVDLLVLSFARIDLALCFADGKDRGENGSSSFCSMFALGFCTEKSVARL
jgi:hypothetical protein